jgi:hypothetical protein
MTFLRETRLSERGYTLPAERRAFRQGYAEGYDGHALRRHRRFPNAFSAGYWEGKHDANIRASA